MPSDAPAGDVVLPCDDLDPTIEWFSAAGFRLDLITPADGPHTAVMSGHGLRLRFEPSADMPSGDSGWPAGPAGPAGVIRLPVPARPAADLGDESTAPNGTHVIWVDAGEGDLEPPFEPATIVSRATDGWDPGRAGMGYRDLIPGRLGGHVIASHIHITEGGPVADYVHHHHISYQLIFCWRGWADLVYEGQGPPFRFVAGDCVLQPPHIRHRVLATSADFDVVEVASPAAHDTFVEHDLVLPTERAEPNRTWSGQRFVHHQAATATPQARAGTPFLVRDLELGAASVGAVTAGVVQPAASRVEEAAPIACDDGEARVRLRVVLAGTVDVEVDGAREALTEGDAVVASPGVSLGIAAWSADAQWLEVLGR
ncbi:MAG: cupin [Actinomycetota bacterium]